MTQEAQLKAYTVADYELAERLVDASNVVTCDGYYELDIKKVAQTLANANTRIESGVVAELKEYVVAFGGPWAVQYSRDFGLPAGHLHPTHYDILEKCGARMNDFTRAMIAERNKCDD